MRIEREQGKIQISTKRKDQQERFRKDQESLERRKVVSKRESDERKLPRKSQLN